MEFVQKKHNLFVPCDVIESQKFLVFGYLLKNLIVILVNWFDFLFTWHSGTTYNYETYSLFVLLSFYSEFCHYQNQDIIT